MEQFLDNIKDLEVTTVARAQEALDKKETATFFIGRKTCLTAVNLLVHCQVSQLKLKLTSTSSTVKNQANSMSYKNSVSRYGIPTVPGFVHIADGQINVRCDSSMSAQEIKEFAGL